MSVRVTISGWGTVLRDVQVIGQLGLANVRQVVKRTANRIADGARARVPRRSGELASTIRTTMLPETGSGDVGLVQVGYGKLPRRGATSDRTKRRSRLLNDRGVYAPVIEFGDAKRNKPAKPFLFPAAEEAQAGFVLDMAQALNGAATSQGLIAVTGRSTGTLTSTDEGEE
jgi:hypothetical protein